MAEYLPAFPFIEDPTIRIVEKLDQAFAILLSQARNSTTSITNNRNEPLVTMTDRVRIRSVIEGTRIVAVEAAAKDSAFAKVQDVTGSFTDTDYEDSAPDDGVREKKDSLNMAISKMYERSLSILGDRLG